MEWKVPLGFGLVSLVRAVKDSLGMLRRGRLRYGSQGWYRHWLGT